MTEIKITGVERIARALGLGSVAQESVDFLEVLTSKTNALRMLCARHDELAASEAQRFCLYDRVRQKEYPLPSVEAEKFKLAVLESMKNEIEVLRNSINQLIHEESQRRK